MIHTRRANPRDWARLFHWRNDPVTRASFLQQEPVSLSDHLQWLAKTLDDDTTQLYIAEDIYDAIGTFRLNRIADAYTCSVTVDPLKRGRGIGRAIIGEMVKMTAMPITATIRATNYASLRTFASAGFEFRLVVEDNGHELAVMEYDAALKKPHVLLNEAMAQ